jgi:hypothetical protein
VRRQRARERLARPHAREIEAGGAVGEAGGAVGARQVAAHTARHRDAAVNSTFVERVSLATQVGVAVAVNSASG